MTTCSLCSLFSFSENMSVMSLAFVEFRAAFQLSSEGAPAQKKTPPPAEYRTLQASDPLITDTSHGPGIPSVSPLQLLIQPVNQTPDGSGVPVLLGSVSCLPVCLFRSLWVLRAVCHVTVEMRGVNGGSCRHDTPAQNSLVLQEGTEESFSLLSPPFFVSCPP